MQPSIHVPRKYSIDTRDISGINKAKMSARAEDLKKILRALLISSPCSVTVDELERDFLLMEVHDVPFREVAYPSFMKYLESIPDTVVIHPSPEGESPNIFPVKRTVPAYCRSVNTTPEMSSSYNRNSVQQKIYVPLSVQNRILKMVRDNPQGIPVKAIQEELFSGNVLEGCDIHKLLGHFNHNVYITDGVVHPLHFKTAPYVPVIQKKMTDLSKTVPTIPRTIVLNMKKLLTSYPAGILSEKIPHLYKKEFSSNLNVQKLGFCSLERFLQALEQLHMLHMPYVNTKIVYPTAPEPEEANPFPHSIEPQDHYQRLYPPEVVGPEGTLMYEKIPPQAIPGAFIGVLVADIITPLNFWIQLRGMKTHVALAVLKNDMQQFYLQEAGNYNIPGAVIKIGQYCVAPYNEEWHRACITAVCNDSEVEVICVDYGTSCKIPKSELLFMHTDFAQLPIQAIRASLANLVPVGGGTKWPHEAVVCFLELVQGKELIAIVSAVDHEENKMEVALVDTSTQEDIHINDVLVYKGHADFRTRRRASPLPPQPKRIDGDPMSSAMGQISLSGTAATYVPAEDPASALATFHMHTETKERASVVSSGVSHLPVVNSGTDLCTADATDLSSGSDDVYRSDDDDDDDDDEEGKELCQNQEQPTLRKSSYVKQIEIAGRLIHLIKIENALFFCTEEVIKHFTDFSACHVVLRILDAWGVKVPFHEIGRTCSRDIIDDLETYNIMGVPKSPEGRIICKVHLTPLNAFTHLIPFLAEEHQEKLCSVVESVMW